MPDKPHPADDDTIIEILAGMTSDVAKMICAMIIFPSIGAGVWVLSDVVKGWW